MLTKRAMPVLTSAPQLMHEVEELEPGLLRPLLGYVNSLWRQTVSNPSSVAHLMGYTTVLQSRLSHT